jgi:hypothetical protein
LKKNLLLDSIQKKLQKTRLSVDERGYAREKIQACMHCGWKLIIIIVLIAKGEVNGYKGKKHSCASQPFRLFTRI